MKTAFIFILTFFLGTNTLVSNVTNESHGTKHSLENLWRAHNFVYITYTKAKVRGLTKAETRAFFTKHLSQIDADKQLLIQEFNHADSMHLASVESWLIQKEGEYALKLDS